MMGFAVVLLIASGFTDLLLLNQRAKDKELTQHENSGFDLKSINKADEGDAYLPLLLDKACKGE